MINTGQITVQILFVIIVLGVFYNLWRTTKAFGGLIGTALKWIGVGMLFFAIEALDRVLGDVSVLSSFSPDNAELVHNAVLLLGLAFSMFGFSRLTRIARQ